MHNMLSKRQAGVLLHITSLPGPATTGDISHHAYRFIEFLSQCGFGIWQLLPLGPTHSDSSPYQCLSTHACSPDLISLEWLVDRGLLPNLPQSPRVIDSAFRANCLRHAHENFQKPIHTGMHAAFQEYKSKHTYWLHDYALFMAIRDHFNGAIWTTWEPSLRDRQAQALRKISIKLKNEIEYHQFCQFVFYTQWAELRSYAHQHGVSLFGDLPIYVALDSADVWAHRDNFMLNSRAEPRYVAGVPPDAFSDTGQRWGNPLYNWSHLKRSRFSWWVQRIRTQFELFDILRIDHFRGLQAYWRIPAKDDTAENGKWVKAPGRQLLKTLHKQLGKLPLVAEDLGLITEEVHALRHQFDLPGMYVLQFAFSGDPHNIYLPHNHQQNGVVYTGTHDNDTSLAWYESLSPEARHFLNRYLHCGEHPAMPETLIRTTLASVANTAILPMQDVLNLGIGHRMNTPATITGNWRWRFDWQQLDNRLIHHYRSQLQLYGRI